MATFTPAQICDIIDTLMELEKGRLEEYTDNGGKDTIYLEGKINGMREVWQHFKENA